MDKQPNSRHCFVCGLENAYGLQLEFYQTSPGEVRVQVSVPEQYQGYPGIVHGGVVAAILDEAAGRALMGADPEESRFMYTARLTVHYRRQVPVGELLEIVGRAVKDRKGRALVETMIYGMDRTVLAEAEALLVDVPEEIVTAQDMGALGWKVYPD